MKYNGNDNCKYQREDNTLSNIQYRYKRNQAYQKKRSFCVKGNL